MKLDMHMHTRGSDGRGSPAQIVHAALAAGLDGIAITDHHRTYTDEGNKVAKLAEAEGLLVFRGAEYSTAQGHLLIYGVDVESFKFGLYPTMQEVVYAVGKKGACVPSHPFKGYSRMLGDALGSLAGLAGVEVINGQCSYQDPRANKLAKAAAVKLGLAGVAGSDSHDPRDIGLAYTVFPSSVKDNASLVRALHGGKGRPVLDTKHMLHILENMPPPPRGKLDWSIKKQ